jgi:hypothetical protein
MKHTVPKEHSYSRCRESSNVSAASHSDGTLVTDEMRTVGGSKMVASFTNKADGRPMEIELKGEWLNMDAQMVLVETGSVLASLSRDFGARDIFGGKQTYYVQASIACRNFAEHQLTSYMASKQVAPGVDLVLIAALAVTFDERQNDKNHS